MIGDQTHKHPKEELFRSLGYSDLCGGRVRALLGFIEDETEHLRDLLKKVDQNFQSVLQQSLVFLYLRFYFFSATAAFAFSAMEAASR